MCGFRATVELAGLHSNPRLEINQTTVYSESKSFGKVIRGKGVCVSGVKPLKMSIKEQLNEWFSRKDRQVQMYVTIRGLVHDREGFENVLIMIC